MQRQWRFVRSSCVGHGRRAAQRHPRRVQRDVELGDIGGRDQGEQLGELIRAETGGLQQRVGVGGHTRSM